MGSRVLFLLSFGPETSVSVVAEIPLDEAVFYILLRLNRCAVGDTPC